MYYKTLKPWCWLVPALALVSCFSFGQDLSNSVIVSPSPGSSSVARYGEYPVDLSTGVPQISIPLYVIESSKLSYPLVLNYHASGIEVNDVSGPVGTGWSLNFPQINRIMRGRPDEGEEGFFSNAASIPDETDPLSLQLLDDLASRQTDMMPDLFYYSTGVSAGTMVFDNQLVPTTLPQSPIKISTNTATLSTFTLTDPGGINFEFEAGETATATLPEGGGNLTYIASWYLARIVSADKLDTVRFNYTLNTAYTYKTSENLGLNFFYNAPTGAYRQSDKLYDLNSNVSVTVNGTRYLSSIEYKGGKVSFNFSSRSDDPDGKKLDHITVYTRDPLTNSYVQERKIIFSYTYFENTDSGTRLRLDRVEEQLSPSNAYNPPYVFSYSAKRLPAPGSTAQDFWGYYNGQESNTSLIPAYTHGLFVISTNDRQVHPEYVQGCVLSTITNPSGGITEYVFESNTYWNGNNDVFGPGLRISKIIRRDPFSSIVATTNYDYTNPSTGKSSGMLVNQVDYFQDVEVKDDIHANSFNYNCLVIKLMATGVGNFSGAPVIYEYVTTYGNNDVNFGGKTVSKFSTYTPTIADFPYFPTGENSWAAGNLVRQEDYKVENNVSTLVRKIENTYDEAPNVRTIKGLSAARNRFLFFVQPTVNDFVAGNYVAHANFIYLKESKVYEYEQGSGSLNLLTTYSNTYDNTSVHLFPTSTKVTTSKSTDVTKQEFKYVADYPSSGVLSVMNSLNMKGLPVDVTTSLSKSGTDYIIDYSKTEYHEWEPGRIYPKKFYGASIPLNTLKSGFQSNPGNYEYVNSAVNSYKRGIAVETQSPGGEPNSLIVDQTINRVVATADASSANQIAYTSFESRDFGNWTINAGTSTSTVNVNLTLTNTFQTISLQNNYTLNYSYTVTQSNGPGQHLIFYKDGTTPIDKYLTGSSGSGSVNLTAGTWNVSLSYDFNVTAVNVSFLYPYTSPNLPTTVTSQSKTGIRSMQLGSSQTISTGALPPGNYWVIYYQKGGNVTTTATGGATVVQTITSTAESDGWTKVQKEVSVTGSGQGVQLTGTTAIYIDELRLHPTRSFMTTTCYDTYKNVTTETDANLRSRFFEYDERRRMSVVRDHEKNIVQHYDYKQVIN